MDLLQQWLGTGLAFIATTLLGILVTRVLRAANALIEFVERETKRIEHVLKTVDETLDLHITPSEGSLFQVGKVIEVLIESSKTAGRMEALLTASFEIVLLGAGRLDQGDEPRDVKAIERELRKALASE